MCAYLVSVIIPVYNAMPFLKEALDSVVEQSYKCLEIIIVDDESTDGSSRLCDEYARQDSRVLVIHNRHGGISRARNTGLEIMHGDLVAFLDADDAYHPEFIISMLEAMIKNNADAVISKYLLFRDTGKMVPNTYQTQYPQLCGCTMDRIGVLQMLAREKQSGGVWNKLYRRELFQDVRFPEGHCYEDVATMYRIFDCCDTVTLIDRGLYFNRNRPGSISRNHILKNVEDRVLASSRFEKFIESNIPSVYSTEDLLSTQQHNLNAMMLHYASLIEEIDHTRESFRLEIVKRGEQIGVGRLCFRTRIAYFILCKFPIFLRIAYPIYMPLRFLENNYKR